MADERDLVRSRVDLVELVSERVKLVRVGKNWKGLCPFHAEKTPSFQVDQQLQLFHCFGCKKGGDLFDWVMQTEGVDFRAALEMLAERAGVTLSSRKPAESTTNYTEVMEEALRFFRECLESDGKARAYAESRGLDEKTRIKWEVGYAPANNLALVTRLQKTGLRLEEAQAVGLASGDAVTGYKDFFTARLMFAVRDDRGKLVAFSGRALGEEQPKYLNSRENILFRKSETLFGLFQSREGLRESRLAILAEGQIDVIACHTAGLVTAVAPLGTSLTEAAVRRLKRYADAVTVMYDGDLAGRRAAEKSLRILTAGDLQGRAVLLPEGADPDSLFRNSGAERLRELAGQAVSLSRFRLEGLRRDWRAKPGIADEGFWTAVKQILTEASPIERDELLMEIAPLHPNARFDGKAVIDALRQEIVVLASVHPKRVGSTESYSTKVQGAMPRAPEGTILRAALRKNLADLVLDRLNEEGLIVSPTGRALADAILEVRGHAGEADIAEIIGALSEELRAVALALEAPVDRFAPEPPQLTVKYVQEALAKLEQDRARRNRLREFAESPTKEKAGELYKSR